jgi:choline dehydrogenase-like flavoprotein
MQRVWDAVIVGAGPTGGLVAEEMMKLGLSVLLLDGGPIGRPGYMPALNEEMWRYPLLACPRTVVVSRTAASLGTTQATWASLAGAQTPY